MTGDRAQDTAAYLERAIELNVHRLVWARNLPWVGSTEPVVRDFALPAVLNRLFKDAVFVAQAVAHGGNLHRRHRIEEARRQAPEAAVTQARIGFLLQQLEPIEVLLLDGVFREVIKKKVRNIVGERAADEKFHREIINPLWILALIGFFRIHPSLRKDIAHGAGDRLKTLSSADRRYFHDVVKEQVPLVERVGISS